MPRHVEAVAPESVSRCGFLSRSHLGMRAHINTDTISLNAESCLLNLSGNSLLEGFVPIQLLNELLGHFCSLLHPSKCQTRVCGQVKVLSLALRKTIFVAAKIVAVRCSLARLLAPFALTPPPPLLLNKSDYLL